MPTFKNFNDLEKYINTKLVKAMELTRDAIFEIVSEKVLDYYHEDVFATPPTDIPDFYQRGTNEMNLMESLTATHITQNGNMYEFRVGWDQEYLQFKYPKGFGKSKYNGITGLQVLQAFNSGTHGYTVEGSHNYWDEALQEIDDKYGGIRNLFKTNCKKVGLPIN